MKQLLKTILIAYCLLGLIFAQFRSDVPIRSLPTNLNGELDLQNQLSFFDPNRLNISHGFTMSMASSKYNAFSVAGLTNRATYLLSNNLILDANITFYKTNNYSQQPSQLTEQLDIGYDAGISYQPTKNSFLQFRLQNIPYYQRYQNQSLFNPSILNN